MKRETVVNYTLKTNGMPDYTRIPKPMLEAIAKKFLENIIKTVTKNTED